uniref:Uncharacterized protein n=1 Tax=Anopheles melas TaxID=34690 RepID=A0A182TQJ1_9DIPT
MDIYYMSDSIQYSSFRGPVYRDYEKFPYGTLENPLNNPVSKTKQQQQQQRRHHSSSSGSTSAQGKLGTLYTPRIMPISTQPLCTFGIDETVDGTLTALPIANAK